MWFLYSPRSVSFADSFGTKNTNDLWIRTSTPILSFFIPRGVTRHGRLLSQGTLGSHKSFPFWSDSLLDFFIRSLTAYLYTEVGMASELGLDPQRIGVYGPSEGGYISAMLGTLNTHTVYDTGQYLNQSSRVQAVVDMWGPTDLTNTSGSPWWFSLLLGHASPAQLRNASPLYHVAPGDPPFLIMQGTDDRLIAPHHSIDMAARLRLAGVPVTLVMIQHDGHGLAMPTSGQVENPSPTALIQQITNFFTTTLAA